MSVAYCIVLDREEPGFYTFVNGKALAHDKKLETLCAQLGLNPLEDFLSMSEEDISDMLDEDIELPEDEGEQWHLNLDI